MKGTRKIASLSSASPTSKSSGNCYEMCSSDGGLKWQDDVPAGGTSEIPADEVDQTYPGAISLP
jgi:hypothetical protein